MEAEIQYFDHLMQRADSFEKTLMLGKIEGSRRRGQQRLRWLDGVIETMDMGLVGLWLLVMDRASWYVAVHGVAKSRTRLNDRTALLFNMLSRLVTAFLPRSKHLVIHGCNHHLQ